MKFEQLNETIPYARYGKEKSLSMVPYKNIMLTMPGRHAEDTSPKGGDFCVCVTDRFKGWKNHQFTHTDLFQDIQAKYDKDILLTQDLVFDYYEVIALGKSIPVWEDEPFWEGLDANTFLCAVQCLAVAEHRRYAQYENKFGGRYLPLRFAAGIADGLWTAADAADKQKKGRPGVEWLEKDFGVPAITKDLMKS